MSGNHERLEVRVTPRYLKEETSSRGELLRVREGREEVKEGDLRVMIMITYLLFWVLMVRRQEESQEDSRDKSDYTEASEEGEWVGWERKMLSA